MGKYSVVASFCDITTRVTVEQALREREAELRRALREREILLRELYHRTRNNMQVVRSMLGLRTRYPSRDGVERALTEIGDRIRAMELVHHQLYESADLSTIDFATYVEHLMPLLRESHHGPSRKVSMRLDLTSLDLVLDQAIPCGLILTELVSNAFKHAFDDETGGELTVTLARPRPGLAALTVSDDGVGFPEGFDPLAGDMLGLRVVRNLAEHQLQGKVHFGRSVGATVRVEFETGGSAESEPR
jgi:two-component sensor histidine kinase